MNDLGIVAEALMEALNNSEAENFELRKKIEKLEAQSPLPIESKPKPILIKQKLGKKEIVYDKIYPNLSDMVDEMRQCFGRERKTLYRRYLRSEYWKTVKSILFKEVGSRCEKCYRQKDSDELTVHHLSYDNLTRELREDLIVLCVSCHINSHPETHYRTSGYIRRRWKETKWETPIT